MRADRLLSLMMLLHVRGRMTAQELAGSLEVSERTIYRDIDALSSAGVPLYTQSGTNGGVFLDENYRISLTGLSRAEIQSLFLSEDAGPLTDLGLDKAVKDSLLKLFAALPSVQRAEVEHVRQCFHIDPTNWFQSVESSSVFPMLQQAVWEDRQINIIYQPIEGQDVQRVVDAYALVAKANIWYLVGRKPDGTMRNYRISRLRQVMLTDDHFERDRDFDLASYWKASCQKFEKVMMETFPPYSATLRVHPDAFWYFPGYMSHRYKELDIPDENGWKMLHVVFDSLNDARMRVLGLGVQVEVLEPDELRQSVLETARAIVHYHEGE